MPSLSPVLGTRGYERVVDRFIATSQALAFEVVNAAFLKVLPAQGARVLDVGAGAGQNASALAQRGYAVVAVEPFPAFLEAAQATYPERGIRWVADSLPRLSALDESPGSFDFVLVDGVWHHLDAWEQRKAPARLAALLRPGGHAALSLRHGPAGAGTHVFPTDGEETAAWGAVCGLETVLHRRNQPSLMPNKRAVTWTRLALRKREATPTPVDATSESDR